MIQEIAQSRITMIAFKNEWQAQWLANSSDLQKTQEVNVMAIDTSAKPSHCDYQINSVKERRHENLICKQIFCITVNITMY